MIGIWGANFEHSIAEALPHNLMNDYIYNFINSNEKNFKTMLNSANKIKSDLNNTFKEPIFIDGMIGLDVLNDEDVDEVGVEEPTTPPELLFVLLLLGMFAVIDRLKSHVLLSTTKE